MTVLDYYYLLLLNTQCFPYYAYIHEEAERRKNIKYAHLEHDHHFIPVAVESFGVFGPQAKSFIEELGRRLEDTTTEPLSRLHLRQRISVAVQRGNSTAIAASCDPP